MTRPELPTIDQMIFKGTHNSYQVDYLSPHVPWDHSPLMNHPPWEQLDDFGVWALELDYGVVNIGPVGGLDNYQACVGHDDCCDVTGFYVPAGGPSGRRKVCLLYDFLTQIAHTRARPYRPTLLYFDIHALAAAAFGASPAATFGIQAMPAEWYLVQGWTAAVSALGEENVIVLRDHGWSTAVYDYFGAPYPVDVPPSSIWSVAEKGFPTVRDCAGKAVIYFPLPEFNAAASVEKGYLSEQGTLSGVSSGCITAAGVEGLIAGGSLTLRLDQYQAGWTFEYGVPPNPIVVDAAAQPPWKVHPEYGPDDWTCDGDAAGPTVGPHGTFRFPYQTVGAAVSRARGTTAVANEDLRRAGYGWTVRIVPGNYPERLTIDIPLTLERDPDTPGTVAVG